VTDKKIIDRYMAKHPNVNPKKLEEYARSKGIHINVMKEVEHDLLKKQICSDLELPLDLDLQDPEHQEMFYRAIEHLPKEKRDEYIKKIK
jgi:hypothetical protein